jgi:hypothetical protein
MDGEDENVPMVQGAPLVWAIELRSRAALEANDVFRERHGLRRLAMQRVPRLRESGHERLEKIALLGAGFSHLR